jgi:hypothetical protein
MDKWNDREGKQNVWRNHPVHVTEPSKRCPLCCAINLEASRECFVCGWHGAFERDVEFEMSSEDDRCEELEIALDHVEWKSMSRSERFWALMRRLLWE